MIYLGTQLSEGLFANFIIRQFCFCFHSPNMTFAIYSDYPVITMNPPYMKISIIILVYTFKWLTLAILVNSSLSHEPNTHFIYNIFSDASWVGIYKF